MSNELGVCNTRDTRFGGKFSCRVNIPSYCNDLISVDEKVKFSATACEDKNQGISSLYIYIICLLLMKLSD